MLKSAFKGQILKADFSKKDMIATSTCVIQDSTTTICHIDYGFLASTTPTIYNGLTAGEILITFFLFLIFLFSIFQFFIFKFLGGKIHKDQQT